MTARLARVLRRPLPFVLFVGINGGILLALEWLVQIRTPAESVAYVAYLLVGGGVGAWALSRLHRTAHGQRLFALPWKLGYLLPIGIVAGILLVVWNVIL